MSQWRSLRARFASCAASMPAQGRGTASAGPSRRVPRDPQTRAGTRCPSGISMPCVFLATCFLRRYVSRSMRHPHLIRPIRCRPPVQGRAARSLARYMPGTRAVTRGGGDPEEGASGRSRQSGTRAHRRHHARRVSRGLCAKTARNRRAQPGVRLWWLGRRLLPAGPAPSLTQFWHPDSDSRLKCTDFRLLCRKPTPPFQGDALSGRFSSLPSSPCAPPTYASHMPACLDPSVGSPSRPSRAASPSLFLSQLHSPPTPAPARHCLYLMLAQPPGSRLRHRFRRFTRPLLDAPLQQPLRHTVDPVCCVFGSRPSLPGALPPSALRGTRGRPSSDSRSARRALVRPMDSSARRICLQPAAAVVPRARG